MNAASVNGQNCMVLFGALEATQETDYLSFLPGPVALSAMNSTLVIKGESSTGTAVAATGCAISLISSRGSMKLGAINSKVTLQLHAEATMCLEIHLDAQSSLQIEGDRNHLLLSSPQSMWQGISPVVTVLVEGEGTVLLPESAAVTPEVLPEEEILEDSEELLRLADHYEKLLNQEPEKQPERHQEKPRPAFSDREAFLRDQYRKGRITLEELERELL